MSTLTPPPEVEPSLDRFSLFLYVLAYVGAFLSFIPFFGILLPLKVAEVASSDQVRLMSEIAIAGAIAASLANILFGTLSDWTRLWSGTRRPWILAGLIATIAAYGLVYLSWTPHLLIGAVILLQIAINMLLAPLFAVMADEVPDLQKGRVAGLLGIAHPLASLAGALLVTPIFSLSLERYVALCLMILAATLPFCFRFRERGAGNTLSFNRSPRSRSFNYSLVWLARLLVQTAGTAISTYIFLFLAAAGQDFGATPFSLKAERLIAAAIAAGTLFAVGLTLAAGRLSDLTGRRKPLIALAAIGMTMALPWLAYAGNWTTAIAAYLLFITAYSVFIALHSAFAMETLPSPRHRGRDLGLLNLTNTIPSLTVPLIILGQEDQTLAPIFAALGAATALGGILMMAARRERRVLPA